MEFIYCKKSQTIRQMPQNYCVATYCPDRRGVSFDDADFAVDPDLIVSMIKMTRNLKFRHSLPEVYVKDENGRYWKAVIGA